MTPAEVAGLNFFFAIISKMGRAWPLLTLLFVQAIGPWVLVFMLVYRFEKATGGWLSRMDKASDERLEKFADRHQEAVKFYNDNVQLVERTLEAFEALRRLTEDTQGLLVQTTSAITELKGAIEHNEFCPLARTDKKVVEVRK